MNTIRTNTWANIGTDISKANNINEALEISGLNYEVVKAPIYLSNNHRIKNQFATKKKGTDEVFGIVGKDYEIVQNSEAFSFVDGIIEEGLTFVKAGETSWMNYIIAKLPEQYILDDKFNPYIIFQNSHAGITTLKAAICPLRIVCSNQFTRAFRNADNKISIRHNASIHSKMNEAQQVLKFAANYMDKFNAEATKLAVTNLSDSTINNIIDNYFVIDENATTRKANSIEENRNIFLNAYNAEDNINFVGTAWGLVNAFSDYITHLDPKRKTKDGELNKFVRVTLHNDAMEKFMNLVNASI